MSGLFAFRQRIWDLLTSNPSETEHAKTFHEVKRGKKRKLSFSSEIDLASDLKKLRIEKDIKREPPAEDYLMEESNIEMKYPKLESELTDESDEMLSLESTDTEETTPMRRIKRNNSQWRKPSGPESNTDYEEEPDEDAVEREKAKLWDDYKIEVVEHATLEDEDFEGWSQQELDFFNRLNDRGIVPMLWSYWKVDFPTFPENLFTTNREDAFIKNWHGNAASGAKALNALIQAGVHARERQQRRQNSAQLLAREVNSYIQWSFRDAKLSKEDFIPLIVVNFANKAEDLETTEARTQARVRKLSEQYRTLWEEAEPKFLSPLPTIFHIFITRTVMGFGSYNVAAENPEFRNIFFTDWKQRGHDLWNAMAVAILVSQTRLWLEEVNPRKISGRRKSLEDPDL